MNRRWIAVAIIAVAVIGIANIIILLVLVPRWSKAANNSPSSAPPAVAQTSAQAPHAAAPVAAAPATAPVAAAPVAAVPVQGTVATTQPATVVRHHPTPPPVQAGLHLERQVVTPSGSLRIRYLRDRAAGTREIAVQDAHNPANEMVLTQYKRTAWVVVSPNDDWIVLERRDKGEEGTVQLFHRVSTAPLKYEVPTELQARGANLRDQIWQSYLSDTQQDPNIDSRRVTIDATAWDPASQKITLNVSPLPSKDDRQVPMEEVPAAPVFGEGVGGIADPSGEIERAEGSGADAAGASAETMDEAGDVPRGQDVRPSRLINGCRDWLIG